MRQFISRAVIVFVFLMLVLSRYIYFSQNGKPDQAQQQTQEQSLEITAQKGEKGKMEQFEEIPPAPGDEEFSPKQEQKEEPAQKPTQKQSQKS